MTSMVDIKNQQAVCGQQIAQTFVFKQETKYVYNTNNK